MMVHELYARGVRVPSLNRHALTLVAITIATIAAPRAAQAAPPELDASGIDGCPSAADLRRAIAGHLGRDDFDTPGGPRASVRVRRTAQDALVADVTLSPTNAMP